MPPLLLPELTQEIAGSNGRLASSVDAEAKRLEEQRTEPLSCKAAVHSAREATLATVARKGDGAAAWQHFLELLEDGLAAEQAKELLGNVRAVITSWLRLAQSSRNLWRIVASLGGPQDPLDQLVTAEQEVSQTLAALERMQSCFNSTRTAVNADRFQRGLKDAAEGRLKNADEVRTGIEG